MGLKREIKAIRDNPHPLEALVNVENALPERVTQVGRWVVTNGRFASPDEVDFAEDEVVYPGTQFGQLDNVFRHRLLAYVRHMLRQVYSPDLVSEEDR